jgi:dephospho-CoA kinase
MGMATEQYWKAQVQELQSELVTAKAQLLVKQKELDSAQLVAQDLQLQLRRLMAKEKAQETALQWDLG